MTYLLTTPLISSFYSSLPPISSSSLFLTLSSLQMSLDILFSNILIFFLILIDILSEIYIITSIGFIVTIVGFFIFTNSIRHILTNILNNIFTNIFRGVSSVSLAVFEVSLGLMSTPVRSNIDKGMCLSIFFFGFFDLCILLEKRNTFGQTINFVSYYDAFRAHIMDISNNFISFGDLLLYILYNLLIFSLSVPALSGSNHGFKEFIGFRGRGTA